MKHGKKVKILKTFEQVSPYLEQVLSFADTNKSALGFLPNTTFNEQAFRRRLWIAACEQSDEFLGYLLFGGRFPSIKIFQIFTCPKTRRKGVASTLVKRLVEFGETNNYLTISSRVAADIAANTFWERVGFQLVRQEPGGKAGSRKINIRARDLDTPSLLKTMAFERPLPSTRLQDIRFHPGPISKSPIYVLDLNVFFDVVKDRLHRTQAALLIQAGLNHQIRVCVTPEFSEELERHTEAGRSDPILEFAREIPTLPRIESAELERLLPELQALVFPQRLSIGKDADKMQSDLVHLAYCIHHRATGFVTREKAILSVSDQLEQNYFLEVLSTADLLQASEIADTHPLSVRAAYGQRSVSMASATEREREEVEQFLLAIGVDLDAVPTVWSPGASGSLRRRITIRSGDGLIGIASWDSASRFKSDIELHLYVDEQTAEAERVIDHVLETVLRDSGPFESRTILLRTSPEQTLTRATALKMGFVRSYPHTNKEPLTSLTKFSFRGLITKDNWRLLVNDFGKLTGLRLPQALPTLDEFQNTGVTIENPKGEPISILKLFDFETLVSPALILCPKRTGLIVPIRACFARDLFEKAHYQMDLFPAREAILHVEKAYFRFPRKIKLFERGLPVLFYLSGKGGGTKEVIGCARVTYSDVLSVDQVNVPLWRQGVLSREELLQISDPSDNIHVFTFDNFNLFSERIPFRFLRDSSLITKANLVSVEPLSADHITRLCKCGFGLEDIA